MAGSCEYRVSKEKALGKEPQPGSKFIPEAIVGVGSDKPLCKLALAQGENVPFCIKPKAEAKDCSIPTDPRYKPVKTA